MKFPKGYEWLGTLGTLPRMVQEGLKEYGVTEIVGREHNKIIMNWASETGLRKVYTADEVPWCGLYIAVVAKRAGKKRPKDPLWALNWAKFGARVGQPCLGDVLVFTRNGGGHVGIYIGEDNEAFHVLGGNQSNTVSITRIDKNRLYDVRRPYMFIGQPPSVKPYILSKGTGKLSVNEA